MSAVCVHIYRLIKGLSAMVKWQWQDPAAIAGKPGPWSQSFLSVHPHSHVQCPTEYRDYRNLDISELVFYILQLWLR